MGDIHNCWTVLRLLSQKRCKEVILFCRYILYSTAMICLDVQWGDGRNSQKEPCVTVQVTHGPTRIWVYPNHVEIAYNFGLSTLAPRKSFGVVDSSLGGAPRATRTPAPGSGGRCSIR